MFGVRVRMTWVFRSALGRVCAENDWTQTSWDEATMANVIIWNRDAEAIEAAVRKEVGDGPAVEIQAGEFCEDCGAEMDSQICKPCDRAMTDFFGRMKEKA